jgi:hypothetical protein
MTICPISPCPRYMYTATLTGLTSLGVCGLTFTSCPRVKKPTSKSSTVRITRVSGRPRGADRVVISNNKLSHIHQQTQYRHHVERTSNERGHHGREVRENSRFINTIQAKFEVFHHAAVASDMTGESLTAHEKVKPSVMVLLDKHVSKLNVRSKCFSLQATLDIASSRCLATFRPSS